MATPPPALHCCVCLFFCSIHCRDLPLDWVPLDEDLLSLELPGAFKVGPLNRAYRWILPAQSMGLTLCVLCTGAAHRACVPTC